MKVLRGAEVGVEESTRHDFIGFHLGDHELLASPLEVPALFGYLGMTGAAEDSLIGRFLDLGTAGAAHAPGLDVVDLRLHGPRW